jgi:hypothetical protein
MLFWLIGDLALEGLYITLRVVCIPSSFVILHGVVGVVGVLGVLGVVGVIDLLGVLGLLGVFGVLGMLGRLGGLGVIVFVVVAVLVLVFSVGVISVCVDVDLVIELSVDGSAVVLARGVLGSDVDLSEKEMSGVLNESLFGLHLQVGCVSVALLSMLSEVALSESVSVQPLEPHGS